MILTVAAQNLLFGGQRDVTGTQREDRWPVLLERLQSCQPRPDIVIVTELAGWAEDGGALFARALRDLGMEMLPSPPSRSGNPVGLLYNRDRVGVWQHWNTEFAGETLHGFGVAAFDVGMPAPLSVVPAHLNTFGVEQALNEISVISNRAYKYGPFALIAGDLNYAPAVGPSPDFAAMNPYNVSMRSVLHDPEKVADLEADRRVAWKLMQAGFSDVAVELFSRSRDPGYLRKTTAQDRIDQCWVSLPMARSIVDYQRLDRPRGASDHDGIAITLDTSRVKTLPGWRYK